jgi:hypothetical protein
MSARLGCPENFELDLPVEPAPLDSLRQMLLDLEHRRDTTDNAGAFLAAVPGARSEEPFHVSDLRPRLPRGSEPEARKIVNLLDGSGCKIESIRRELVRCAAPEAAAVVLELGEIAPRAERRGYDIAALSLIGPGYAIPVGLRRLDFPRPGGPSIDLIEHRTAVELLGQLRSDFAELALGAPPPLVSFDHRYAENHRLRRHILELEFEYALAVGHLFDELGEAPDPYASQLERPQLSDKMPFGLDGTPPEPRLYSLAPAP